MTLFHVTGRRNRDSIAEHGLRPMFPDESFVPERQRLLWLFTDEQTARSYLDRSWGGSMGDNEMNTNREAKMLTTLNVRGQKLTCRSQRRYIAVAVRPEAVEGVETTGTHYIEYCRVADRCIVSETIRETRPAWYVAYAHVVKRSDNPQTLVKATRGYNPGPGAAVVIIDRVTGEEI